MEEFNVRNIAPWMTQLWLDSIPITNFYTPSMKNYCLSEFAFFLIDDEWDTQSLTNLKYRTGAAFLFGLQTTSKCVDKIDVVDGIIVCKPDEVQQVMKVSEVMSNRKDKLITTDFDVIKQALQFTKPAQFIQATTVGTDKLDRAKRAINQIISQIHQDNSMDVLILRVKTAGDLSLEEYCVVSEAIENIFTDDISIWYGMGHIDVSDCCWIEAIYMVK
ncbi:hypothetical protein [Psychrobacter sp. DAB_AL62B]|uniref:hypothetical protein n=1 Tax=Psychrobacter sp. DAB_AL62B TaxID=1028420 RepID=UPI0023814C17|nr:hypothetical protein [Psychrobacter sp. DAB_AL62B]MDE4456172.1 hypothetical protein [Psychrobacter sp. DAB_AL62B]